ncbi:hypothetical protein Pan216_38570 [Planctomycetes bacterium Pan216]|uniref:Urease accessory protein UreH-like transmembrane domain-containing protein n=2 Tax=Kolteria novifilia TaxID=2527975 RepID=A0A518B7Q4_9BACT|nr:hypothetical protein Pan216_38570 [Planctomycetes bacterium Pan216]
MIFVSGVLGSSHCLGMCGGFVVSIGSSAPTPTSNLARQLVYSAGRLFTYTFLGAVGGFVGLSLIRAVPTLVHGQAVLALVAGLLLVLEGAASAKLLPFRSATGSTRGCLAGTLLSDLLTSPQLMNSFLAGVLTGLLPCGLVYAFLALAVSSGSMVIGGLMMALFGLGTVPTMLIAGCGSSLLSLRLRRHAFTIAAYSVMATGAVSVLRGVALFTSASDQLVGWPLCG